MITENTLGLLEFPRLLSEAAYFAHSEASRDAILACRPLGSLEEIEERLGQVEEIRRLSREGSPLGISAFPDISHLLIQVRPEGAVLEPLELAGFLPIFTISAETSLQVKDRTDLPLLRELTGALTGFPYIYGILERSVDSEGNILDSASPALAGLRGRVRRVSSRIRKRLEEMMREESLSVFLQDSYVTERSGRLVIPVRMDSKGQVPGVVHDVSRSGETAFIEPLAIIQPANELENLIAEQKAEERRILRDISSMIRSEADGIESEYRIIVNLDMLCCIAGLSDRLNMQRPRVHEAGSISLVDARHPLLMLSLGEKGGVQGVVPLDLGLGGDATVMVITGSNAGGKTVAIKTIGMLLIMALSGMPVPADSSSSFPIVRDLLADIGDEQSIEKNLSTFSAHVKNISEILRKADRGSLVLLDELGTGTDPEEGGALSCAVLRELRESGALLFATTHLTDIKGFVHRSEGMINASMEFDHETLTPLYRLRVGAPGRSHAIETAQRLGMPGGVIDAARMLLGGLKADFDDLIADLNDKSSRYDLALVEISRRQSELEEKNRLLDSRLEEAERNRKEMLSKACDEASAIIGETKRQMHAILDDFKRNEREKRRELMRRVDEKLREIAVKSADYTFGGPAAPSLHTIKKGDVVFVRSIGRDASVTDIDEKHGRIRVRAGNLEIGVALEDIRTGQGMPVPGKTEAHAGEMRGESVARRINLVGMRVDEAISRLEPFLNHASLSGLDEVTVIHGYGTGVLARAVREHLDDHPLVKTFRKGEPGEGGGGVTVIELM
jgi:DNA mismatch repair protein MutS2